MSSDTLITDDAVVRTPATSARLAAEILGTFLLVGISFSTALFFGDPLKVALAIGLTVFMAIAAFGGVSGGHFNPAVTLGLAVAGRFEWKAVPGYMLAQIIGGLLGSTLIFGVLANGPAGALQTAQQSGFASNGFGELSPAGFNIVAVLLVEVVFTAVFLFIILGVTGSRGAGRLAPLAIGFALTAIHLATIPVSNTSLNPARSIATAVYGGAVPLSQLWLFVVAPLLGAFIAGALHRSLFERESVAVTTLDTDEMVQEEGTLVQNALIDADVETAVVADEAPSASHGSASTPEKN